MHTILVIEDEESLRLTLAERLTMEGYRVQTAADGQAGIRLALAEPPDLILCDVMMPVLDGYGVLQALQADARTAPIPFLFLTAKADPSQVRAGMGLGADDYLCKPVAKADLLASVRSRIEKHRRQQQRLEHLVETARLEVVRRLPHELRTPLTSLFNASQLLEIADPAQPVPGVRALGRAIRLASQRLHRTTYRFLLYAELAQANQPGKRSAQLDNNDYHSITALTTHLVEQLARQHSRLGDLQFDLCEVELPMSLTHYGELVVELVDNALKFSLPGSQVRILMSVLPKAGCLLEVCDQGRGMTPDQVRKVGAFRQFDREHWAQAGTGLGLTIVKQLASLYQGSFVLESDPAKGTRAGLHLTNARLPAPDAKPIDPALCRKVAWELGVA